MATTPNNATCLYIIGNGFDLYHKIPSSYTNFREWLKTNRPSAYESLNLFYDNPTDAWWSSFEENLAYIKISKYIKHITSLSTLEINQRVKNLDSTNWSLFHNDTTRIYSAKDLADLAIFEITVFIKNLSAHFREWIQSLEINIPRDILLDIDPENTYCITFNYTNILESDYNYPTNQITHIHNAEFKWQDLIFGHGSDEATIIKAIKEELIIAETELQKEIAKHLERPLIDILNSIRKDSTNIIIKHSDLFKSLGNIHTVIILGFSFSPIDEIYLNKILSSIKPDSVWYASYYTDNDRNNANNYFQKHNIKHSQLIEIDDLLY